MQTHEKLALMMSRFVHTNSKFAQQVYFDKEGKRANGTIRNAGTYFYPVRRGDCTHTPKHTNLKDCSDAKDILFSTKFLRQHLMGDKTYAPYQISDDGKVKWLCLDIDAYNDPPLDEIQQKTIDVVLSVNKKFGKGHCLVESSGTKGYHVWLFFSEPIDVGFAFALGHELTNGIPSDGTINVEVYPKQQSNKVFGNTVKLPLGIHQKSGNRCFFVKGDFTDHEDQWGVLASVQLIDSEWVKKNVQKTPLSAFSSEGRVFVRYTPHCLTEIMEVGASEGIRDESAFRIANYFRSGEYPDYIAQAAMEKWNERNDPPLDEEVLDMKIASAYNGNYPYKPCHLPVFDQHCHSACPFFEKKKEKRWFKKDESPIGQISRD